MEAVQCNMLSPVCQQKCPNMRSGREVKESGNPLKLKCKEPKVEAGKLSAALGKQRNKGAGRRRCNLKR